MLGAVRVGDSLVELIESATGGVPAGVESVVRQLVTTKALRADTAGAVSLGLDVQPDDLHGDWLGSAVASLDANDKQLLRLLSLLRNPAQESVLEDLMNLSVEKRLSSLRAKGLVGSVTRGDRIFFRASHDGVRRAVSKGMEPMKRTIIHDQIATYLKDHPGMLHNEDSLWHQCLGSNPAVAFRAFLQFRQQLGDEWPDALRHVCEAMLEVWPLHRSPSERQQVEIEMLRARIRLGEFVFVQKLAPEAAARATDPESLQVISNYWCDALRAQGRFQEAFDVLGDSVAGRPGIEGRHRKALMLSHLGRLKEALQLCQELEAELGIDDPLLVDVVDAKVSVLWELEELDQARGVLVNALENGLGNFKSAWVLWTRLGQLEVGSGRMAEARRCFETARSEAERIGDRYGICRGLSGIAVTQAETGALDAAHETFLQVLDLSQRLGESVNGTNILGNLGQMLSVQGLYGKSFEYASRGIRWASETAMMGLLTRIRIIRAGVLAKLGAVDEVFSDLREVFVASESDRYRGQALAVQAELAVHLREQVQDIGTLEEALQLFRSNSIEDEMLRVMLLIARGLQSGERYQEALAKVDRVAHGAANLRLPDLVVEAETLRAELLSESDPETARQRATRTLELARHFGFRDSMWRGEALLARLCGGDDRATALSHYRACLDLFREMTEGLPEHLSRSFLRLPRQREILQRLKSM